MSILAINGGKPAIHGTIPAELFSWPVVTPEDEAAVLDVLRRGAMSGLDVTEKFEREFADWLGSKYAIGYCNGTLSLQAAMFACGLGKGDELICPSKTYWASCIQAFNMNATVVFADIERDSLCIDPADIERCIGPKTKAIMVVHYLAHPADMDAIMAVAKKHNLKVIEDVSHAQGGLYRGRKLGTIGDIGAMSLMSGKSFATGEMGMLVTDNREMYDRAMAYSHYERNNASYIETEYLKPYFGLPLGGMKGRVNQTCSAMGRVQLKYYDERCRLIREGMNYFWDLLEGLPGIRAHRVSEAEGSNMAGWYAPHGLYNSDELEGLSVSRFCEAVRAEGVSVSPGGNNPLHTHNVFKTADIYNAGTPTRIMNADRDVRELDALPVTEELEIYSIPWFKRPMHSYIEMYAAAFRKVAENYRELLGEGKRKKSSDGRWFFYNDKED
ncbi:MAG: DegT/DnrJ/EryC1/StrS family aminotransferase [Eubacteriales bacterium]|jgi:perosamine synthetase|nr:DegT/DnrJ/EryC1/StrS family aminotransferase [Eubacteriales bacterium]